MKINNVKIIKFFWLKLIKFLKKFLFSQVDEVYIRKLDRELCQDATWNLNYIILTVSSCLIATFGLISNSTAVIIGAMLVAPLMLPLRALAFGALEGDFSLFKRAFFSILGATVLALGISYLAGDAANIPQFGSEVLARTQPNLVDLGIAVVAGSISSFAKVRKGISDVIAGTAIAVALMPPLCVVGLALSQQQLSFARGAFILYLTNLLGITLSCMIVFILAGYTRINHALGWTLALTGVLVLPLGASFLRLVRQAELTQGVTDALNMTITVSEGVDNAVIEVDWTEEVPIVYILLQTDKEVFPNQVALVEKFIEERMNQSFKLIFFVNKFTEVTAEESEELLETKPQIKPELPGQTDNKVDSIIPIETEQKIESETLEEADQEIQPEISPDTNSQIESETLEEADQEIQLEISPDTNRQVESGVPEETNTEINSETSIKTKPEIELETNKETDIEILPESPKETETNEKQLDSFQEKTTPQPLITPINPSSRSAPKLSPRLYKTPKNLE